LKFYLLFAFFSFDLCKVFAFCSLCSDNENPKRDTAIASVVDTPASNEPPSQEAGAMVKSPEAPVKKGNSCASKRLKKQQWLALPLTPIDQWFLLTM
jgi:hypothetical protein